MQDTNIFKSNKYSKWYYSLIQRATSRIQDSSIYYEKHHILPKSLGGDDSEMNLVLLTAKEHFVCHLLLTKMVEGRAKFQMIKALHMMTISTKYQHRINSSTYASLKAKAAEAHSVLTKGKPKHSAETRLKMSIAAKGRPSPNLGKKLTPEQSQQRSEQIRKAFTDGARKVSEETKAKISRGNTGKRRTDETKARMSDSARRRPPREPMSEALKEQISQKLKGRPSPMKGRDAHNKGIKLSSEEKDSRYQKYLESSQTQCEHCNRSMMRSNYARWHGSKCKLAK